MYWKFAKGTLFSLLAVTLVTVNALGVMPTIKSVEGANGQATWSVQITSSVPEAAASTVVKARHAYGRSLPPLPGTTVRVWAGTWKFGQPYSYRGFCIDPKGGVAYAQAVNAHTGKLPNYSTADSRRVKYLVNKYSASTSNAVVSRVYLAIRVLYDDSKWWSYIKTRVKAGQLNSSDVAKIKSYLAESTKNGPYNVHVTAKPVMVGESGVGSVRVAGLKGAAPPSGGRVTVKVTSGNATITSGKSGAVSSKGNAAFTFKRTGSGKVTIKATVTYPSAKKVKINKRTSSSQQRIVGGRFTDSFVGTVSFEMSVGAQTITSTCDTNCNGNAVVTVKQCVSDALAGVLLHVFKNGKLVKKLAIDQGDCKKATFKAKDADVVITKVCVTGGPKTGCTSAWFTNSAKFEVECPAWASAEITVGCNCEKQWARVSFKAPKNARHYTGIIVISDGRKVLKRIPVALVGGETVTVSIRQKLKAGVEISTLFTVKTAIGKVLVRGKELAAITVKVLT